MIKTYQKNMILSIRGPVADDKAGRFGGRRRNLNVLRPWFPEIIGFILLSIILILEICLVPTIRAGETELAPANNHLKTPSFVKGIYISANTAASPKARQAIFSLFETTELNSAVIDLKDDYGYLAFPTTNPKLAKHRSKKIMIKDLGPVIEQLHKRKIYIIGRLPVFQDRAYVLFRPEFAVKDKNGGNWHDKKAITWLDPTIRDSWEYNVWIAQDAYALGFDEIQFDYIRFPSDGDMTRVRYAGFNPQANTPVKIMRAFFAYLDTELRKKGIPISADLFGFAYWDRDNDLTIGQRIIDAAPFFDALSPMVYPSHYPAGTLGYKNPADYPYEIIAETLKRGKKIMTEFPEVKYADRPWLQDFDIGANYDAKKIRAEMKAVVDNGGAGWLLWNARNVYTLEALEKKTPKVEKSGLELKTIRAVADNWRGML